MVEAQEVPITGSTLYLLILADFLLLCGAALFAGLTLSVMGLDTLSLEIIATSGKDPDRVYAGALLPVRRAGNRLLCTLILGNVMVNTLIAQITDRLVKGWTGTALATALITLGGEIIPQATMAAHALQVGAASVPICKLFLWLFYPICGPLSYLLDRFVGTDPGQIYSRNELRKLMALHASSRFAADSGIVGSDFSMMMGAMDLHDKTVLEAMTPLVEVFMVEATDILNDQLVHEIWESGHSRIPVYRGSKNNVIGLLFAKDLLLMRTDERISVLDVCRFYTRMPLTVYGETKLIVVLQEFRTGKSHLALVRQVTQVGAGDPVYETVGIVTLEDVIEELLRANIEDEYDVRADDDTVSPNSAQGGGPRRLRSGAAAAAGRALKKPASSLDQKWLGVSKDLIRGMRKTTLEDSHARVASMFLVESVAPFAGQDPQRIRHLFVQRDHVVRIKAPLRARQLPLESKANMWLYRKGVPTNFMALVIAGAVEIFMDDAGGDTATTSSTLLTAASTAVATTNTHSAASAENSSGAGAVVPPLQAMFADTTAASLADNHHVRLLASDCLPVMEMTQWTVLGASVLSASTPTIVPDFSARIVANSLMLLISSGHYREVMHHHYQQQKK